MQSKHNNNNNNEWHKQDKTEKTRDADYGARSSSRGVPWSQCSQSLWGTHWTKKWKSKKPLAGRHSHYSYVVPITCTQCWGGGSALVDDTSWALSGRWSWQRVVLQSKKEEAIGLCPMGGLVDVANCDLSKISGRFPLQLPFDTIRTRLEFFWECFSRVCISYNYLVIKLFVKSPSLAPSLPSLSGIHKVMKFY
jgi:hypothetical protein